jgi:hypothetical protein
MNLILHSYSYVQIHNNIGNLKRKAVKVTAIFEGKIKKLRITEQMKKYVYQDNAPTVHIVGCNAKN